MAILPSPESGRGVLGAIKGAFGLFDDTNKAEGIGENSNPFPIDEYESNLDEVKVIELKSLWLKTYAVYYDLIEKTQKLAYSYWVGVQKMDENAQIKDAGGDVTDNLMFEAIETFLPIATRANPDPLVSADPSDIGQKLAKDIKIALVNWADITKLRRKLARQVRHWLIYRIGTAKLSWDPKIKTIKMDVVNARRMIFDKDGYIDEAGHFVGEYLGEKKKFTAEVLVEMFPRKKGYITAKAKGKMGTKLEFYEWWYKGTDLFYTLDDVVLGKYKNPNWNYDIPAVEPVPATEEDPETGAPAQIGIEGQDAVPGVNHLKEPSYPYIFLSIFSLGLQPHDDTSLIMQNISIQDLINRRYRQLDKNINSMNEGIVVSGRSFTEDQAAQASSALRRGMAIRVPDGDVDKAIKRLPAVPLPSDVPNNLNDARNELRGIFGTSGSTPQAVQKEDTVRGKILVNQQDSSRIGGGITEQLEQVADSIYNLVVQFMFVYYDEDHFISTAGQLGGKELIALKNASFPELKTLDITVKEGSMVPKDPLSKRNEAIDLWSANAIDPFNFYKALDFPDPAQATQQLILWQMFQRGQIAPQQYLPSFTIPQPQGMAQGQLPSGVGGPAVNNIDASPQEPQTPVPQSPPAVEQQSQDLLRSVPVQ